MPQSQQKRFQKRSERVDHLPLINSIIVRLGLYLIVIMIAGTVPLLFFSISRFKVMVMLTIIILAISSFVIRTDKEALFAWVLLLSTAIIYGFSITPDNTSFITISTLLLPVAVIWLLFSSQGIPITIRGFKAPFIAWSGYLLNLFLTTFFFGSYFLMSATTFFFPFSFLLYLLFWERLHATFGVEKMAYYSRILFVIALLESVCAISESLFHFPITIFMGYTTLETDSKIRAGGTIGTHTGFGNYMAVLLPYIFAHFTCHRSMFRLLAFIGCIIALFLSGTRIAYFAAFASLLFMVPAVIVRKVISMRRILLYLAILLILPAIIAIPVRDRILQFNQAALVERGDTMSSRIASYKTAIEMFKDSNGLGVGLKNYKAVALKKNYPSAIPVHNSYLLVLAESGLLGLFLFLLTLFLIFKRVITVVQTADTGSFRFYAALAAGGSLVSFMVCSVLNMTVEYGHTLQLFWNIVAISLVCSSDREPQRIKSESNVF